MMAVRHPEMGDVHMATMEIPDDPDGQVAATIDAMRAYAIADANTTDIHRDVANACRESVGQIERCAALWRWVKQKIRFKEDRSLSAPIERAGLARHPVVEVLVRPIDISRGAPYGDCDDFSMYLASLLTACGIPCSFVTVAADSRQPENYSHVYVAAYPNGQRVPLDSSHGEYPGWEVPRYTRRTEWPVASELGGWA